MAELFVKEFSTIAVVEQKRKARLIRRERDKDDYHPAKDFYKYVREAIVKSLKQDLGVSYLHNQVRDFSGDKAKKPHFVQIEKSFIEAAEHLYGHPWFSPPRAPYINGGVTVIVNPEIGVNIDGRKYVIKLYFSEAELGKGRANYMTCLMDHCFGGDYLNAVLDVRRREFYTFTGDHERYIRSINNEFKYIKEIWDGD